VLARRQHIQQRDPNAFSHKLAATAADTLTNRKGCKCKRSHCLKKYCECFQVRLRTAAVLCSVLRWVCCIQPVSCCVFVPGAVYSLHSPAYRPCYFANTCCCWTFCCCFQVRLCSAAVLHCCAVFAACVASHLCAPMTTSLVCFSLKPDDLSFFEARCTHSTAAAPASLLLSFFQMGVHCGELCKCSDCQNIDNGDGIAAPGSSAKSARSSARANSTSSQQRLQHTANLATLGGYWSLGQQQLGSAVSSGTGTPVAAAAAVASSAGFGAMAGLSAQAGQTSECCCCCCCCWCSFCSRFGLD
jgi:hypothetical protein